MSTRLSSRGLRAHDVRPERADVHFGALALQLDADRGCEMTQIVGEPRREVVRLVVPRLARVNRIQCSQRSHRHAVCLLVAPQAV